MPVLDLLDQRSQPRSWKIQRRENASRGIYGNLLEKLLGVIVNVYSHRLARECVQDTTALIRKRIDELNGFGLELSPRASNHGRATR